MKAKKAMRDEYRAPSIFDVFRKSTCEETIRLVAEILIAVSLLIYFIVAFVLKMPYESCIVVILSLIGGIISLQDLVLQIILSKQKEFQEYKRQYTIAENMADEARREIEEKFEPEAKELVDKIAKVWEEKQSENGTDKRELTADEMAKIIKKYKFTKEQFEIFKELMCPGSDDLIESDEERQQTHELIESIDEYYEKIDAVYRKFYVISILASILIVVIFYISGVNASGKEWITAADIATAVGFVTMLLTKAVGDVYERYVELLRESFDTEMNEG